MSGADISKVSAFFDVRMNAVQFLGVIGFRGPAMAKMDVLSGTAVWVRETQRADLVALLGQNFFG